MKDIISITEMAKLRGITTETLRHYHRIGVLKPVYIEPNTGYRFYSVTQYEKIGTIRELRNLGMSLREIKEYLDNRNIETSKELLVEQKQRIDRQINKLVRLRKEVNKKIDFLEVVLTTDLTDEIRIKRFGGRKYVTFKRPVTDEIELSYDSVRLEGILKGTSKQLPIFATNRYGGLIAKEHVINNASPLTAQMIICCQNEKVVEENIITVPGGEYVCIFYVGAFWNRKETIGKIMNYIKKHNMELCGDILQMQWVDFAITDNLDEISYEFQAPIKRGDTK